MRVIAIANQKGGCGKTTTAINLSSSLSSKGKSVLLIDFDPQSHATMGLNVDYDYDKSMYNVITPRHDEHLGIEDILVSVKENFDLAPSNVMLTKIEQEFAATDGRESRLFQAIQEFNGNHDYVVIDCPPSIGHLCFNALRACEEVIIPIDMSLFSLRGVAKLIDIVVLLKDECGHVIRSRALVTMYDFRTRYSRLVLENVKEQFGDNVFETVIRYNIRLRETVDYGLPVGDYDKHAIGHKDYEKLAEEVTNSGVVATNQREDRTDGAYEMVRRTGEYIRMVAESSVGKEPTPEVDEFFPYAAESSYSHTHEAMATNPNHFASEDEEDDE